MRSFVDRNVVVPCMTVHILQGGFSSRDTIMKITHVQGDYFIRQLSVATSCRLPYRINFPTQPTAHTRGAIPARSDVR